MPLPDDRLKRIVADQVFRAKSHRSKAVRLVRNPREFIGTDPVPLVHNPLRVLPSGIDPCIAPDGAAKIDIDLVKRPAGIVEFIDKAWRAHVDMQARLFVHFPDQVGGQGGSHFDTTPRCAQQVAPPVAVGVDQKQAICLNNDRAYGKAG